MLDLNMTGMDFAPHIMMAAIWTAMITEGILFLPTVFGNALILLCLLKFKNLRVNPMHKLIGFLAVSDLFVGFCIIPIDFINIFTSLLHQSKWLCLIATSLPLSSMGISATTVTVISIERFLAIKFPLKHRFYSSGRKLCVIVPAAWIAIIACAFIPLFGWNRYNTDQPVCLPLLMWSKEYQWFIIAFTAILLLLNLSLLIFVVQTVKQHTTKLDLGQGIRVHRKERTMNDLAKVSTFISGTFLLCWTPFLILIFISAIMDNFVLIPFMLFAAILGVMTACFNWIIYGILNPAFRKAAKSIIYCTKTKRKTELYRQSAGEMSN